MNGIKITNVSKTYGNVCALNNVSLTFEPNKIYGLLGRNGAGKTTLLNVITNRIFADSGEVLIDNQLNTSDNALNQVYLMSEKNYYPENMKIKEMFSWSKEFYSGFDEEYANLLAENFSLNTNKKVKTLSTGFNSIAKIIIALSVNVNYVLLDEPVLGLDANNRELFYKLLLENYSNKPKTIIISTHLIEEAANVIEDIVIIKNGEILRNQSCEALLSEAYTVTGSVQNVDEYIKDKKVIGSDILGNIKSSYILGKADKSDLPLNLEITKPDLQKLFIRLTNE